MKILICGAGFIGGHLRNKLKYSNKVTTIGRSRFNDIEEDLSESRIELYDYIINRKPDLIYHLAANPNTKDANCAQDNINITLNILNTMVEAKSEARLIYASSATVYSNRALLSYASEIDETIPESIYGASKLAGELLIKAYAKQELIKPACILRLVATVGAGANHGIVPDVIRKVKEAKDCRVQLIGQRPGSTKPFVHVDDVVSAMHFLGVKQLSMKTNTTFNISNSDSISSETVAELICDELKMPRCIEFGAPGWAGDNNMVRVSSIFASVTGWKTTMDSSEAIRKAVRDICGIQAI